MHRLLFVASILVVTSVGLVHARVLPQVEVTACGQVVPDGSLGYLAADLDCTGFTGGPSNAYQLGGAVYLGRKSVLDLRGFSLTGSAAGVWCDYLACGVRRCPTRRCEVFGGTVRGSEPGSIGIWGTKLVVHDVTVTAANSAIVGFLSVRATNVTASGNRSGVHGGHVTVVGSSITGNTETGVSNATFSTGARIADSTVTGNGLDVFSYKMPRLKNTVCETSAAPDGTPWGVCSLD